jgi:hypothetical protein
LEKKKKEKGTDALLITTAIIASILSAAIYYAIEVETGKTIIAVVAALIVSFVLAFLGIIMSIVVEIRNKIEK